MSVVVNVIVSLNECNEPTSCLVQPIGTHVVSEVMYFGCVFFRGKLGFLNCDDIRLMLFVIDPPLLRVAVEGSVNPIG